MTAALAAPYTTDDEKPASRPAMLPLLMMLPEPWRRIWGAACFMPSITLRTRVAIAASKRATSRPSMPPVCAGPPALLNRQSMRPNFSTAWPISARIWSSTVTSVWRKTQWEPSFLANASPSGARRPAMTILAPSATKTSAVRKPMPLVAPVITATLPSSRPISFSFLRSLNLIDDGRLNHGPELIAQHDAVAVVDLDHIDGDQLLLGVDPEQRAGVARPAVFPERSRQRRISDAGADLKSEAESQARRPARPRTDVIGGHEFDRLAAEQPLAREFSAVGEHDCETKVIVHRAGEAAAAGFEAGLLRHVETGRHRRRLRDLPGLGGTAELAGRHIKPGIGHAEWCQNALIEKFAKGLARHHFDHAAQHVGRNAIFPAIAGRESQRQFP